MRFLVESRFGDVHRLCREYLSSGPAELRVAPTASDVDAERKTGSSGDWSDGYLETLAVYRQIAERLPLRDRMLVHGAAVVFQGAGYLFCAPSGTGKSTHAALWRKNLGAVIVNGDKPIVQVPASGPAVVHGTPWAGKEGWQCNASAPLAGICFLDRGKRNRIHSLEPAQCLDRAVRQTYLPADGLAAARTLELLDALLSRVPSFELACDMTEEALRCSFEGMTGREYDASKRA